MYRLLFLLVFCIFLAGCAPDEREDVFGAEPGIDGIVFNYVGLPNSNRAEFADGIAEAARFFLPEGLAIVGDLIYVSDTGNRVIRKIDTLGKSVDTIAGIVGSTSALKDGPGFVATFSAPAGIYYHPGMDSLFIADRGFNVVRQVKLNSALFLVSTLTGVSDAVGNEPPRDGGPTEAVFSSLTAITGDGSDTLYVLDGDALRKITISTGQVDTIAGMLSDLEDITASRGSADGNGNTLNSSDPTDIIYGDARFYDAGGLAKVGNSLYIADSSNHKIRRVRLDQTPVTVTTVAGTYDLGSDPANPVNPDPPSDGVGRRARFTFPTDIASDGKYLFVSEASSTIRKIELETMAVVTLAGNFDIESRVFIEGIGSAASFALPSGIAISDDGNSLYVSNRLGNNIAVVR